MNIKIQPADPLSSESQSLVDKLSSELATITGDSGKTHFNAEELSDDRCVWAIARDEEGNAVGCGALRPLSQETAELKRMYSDRSVSGVGAALLNYLETQAKGMGYSELKLSTRIVNARAVAFYQRHGYVKVENYGPYLARNESICLAKKL